MNKSIFISLEGVDGAGKSTHIQFIENYFRSNNLSFFMTREPGGTTLGERLRSILLHDDMHPLTETLLMFASRCEHINQIIKPKLGSNTSVISDRFTDATFAYQHGGKGIDIKAIEFLKNIIQKDLEPDLTFLFDLPIEVSMDRLHKTRDMDRFEKEDQEFHQAIRSTYLKIAKNNPERFYVIDGTKSISDIQQEMNEVLNRFFS